LFIFYTRVSDTYTHCELERSKFTSSLPYSIIVQSAGLQIIERYGESFSTIDSPWRDPYNPQIG